MADNSDSVDRWGRYVLAFAMGVVVAIVTDSRPLWRAVGDVHRDAATFARDVMVDVELQDMADGR